MQWYIISTHTVIVSTERGIELVVITLPCNDEVGVFDLFQFFPAFIPPIAPFVL